MSAQRGVNDEWLTNDLTQIVVDHDGVNDMASVSTSDEQFIMWLDAGDRARLVRALGGTMPADRT